MSDKKVIVGWDLSAGGGARARELSTLETALGEAVLYYSHPGLMSETESKSQVIDIFGLDPRLTIIPQVYYRLRFDGLSGGGYPGGTEVACPATLKAYAITRSNSPLRPVRVMYELGADALFGNAGVVPDGCEIASGMQGIRLQVDATLNSPCDYEIVASLLAIPNIALNCLDLARAMLARLEVEIPKPHTWTPIYAT